MTGAATTQGHALSVGENRKMAAHAEACRSVGVTFVPLVVESLGGWSETAVHSIKSIGRQLGQRLGIPPTDFTTHLFQRLSIYLSVERRCRHVDKVLHQLSRGGWSHLNI